MGRSIPAHGHSREGRVDGNHSGLEIDFGRQNPSSLDKLSLFRNVGDSLLSGPEWEPGEKPTVPGKPNSRYFPAFSLWIREATAETSSPRTPRTAIESAEAETFRAQ